MSRVFTALGRQRVKPNQKFSMKGEKMPPNCLKIAYFNQKWLFLKKKNFQYPLELTLCLPGWFEKLTAFWCLKHQPISNAYHVTSKLHFRFLFGFNGSPRYRPSVLWLIKAKFSFQNHFLRKKGPKWQNLIGTAPRRQSRVVPLCATFKVAKGAEKVFSLSKI